MQLATGGRGLILLAVAVGLSACNAKGRTDYSKSPDSGAVAPAIRQDTSLTRTYPESTTVVRIGRGSGAWRATRLRRVDSRLGRGCGARTRRTRRVRSRRRLRQLG